MKVNIHIPVLMLSTFLLFYACQNEKVKKEKKQFIVAENDTESNVTRITAKQFEDLGMVLGTASMNIVEDAINVAGYIEVPQESKAEVRSFMGGYLGSSPLLPGDYVKKGQLLISLENLNYIQLQQEYLQVKEELFYLKTVYERQKILAEEKISSQNRKQQAESEYKSALANYEGLRKKINLNCNSAG